MLSYSDVHKPFLRFNSNSFSISYGISLGDAKFWGSLIDAIYILAILTGVGLNLSGLILNMKKDNKLYNKRLTYKMSAFLIYIYK